MIDQSDTNRGYARTALRALAEEASRLPPDVREHFLRKRVDRAWRAMRKRRKGMMASALHFDDQLRQLIADLGASESPSRALEIWSATSGTLYDRFDALLDKLTFHSAHCRVAAQLKAESSSLLLQASSEYGHTYSQVLDELGLLDHVRSLLAEQKRATIGALLPLSKLTQFVAELNYWLPGVNWEWHSEESR